jgi:glucose 1-dehydrogenase
MEIQFSDKVVAITGAGGGIGSAMAVRFAESGAKVAVCDIKGAEATVEKIHKAGGDARAYALDVTQRKNVADVCRRINDDFGGIDIWINNAGINVGPEKRSKVYEFDDAWWDAIIKVDLEGTYNCSKAVIPYLKTRKGNIINISSTTGMVPLRKQCAFTSAKAGVIMFSKSMAIELADEGIRVNVISPGSVGLVNTNKLFADPAAMEGMLSHIPQHRQGTPDDIAYTAMFLASDKAGYITGTVINVDGGWICGYTRDF